MRRMVACLLAAVLCFSLAAAAGEPEWKYNTTWGYLEGYSGSGGDVTVPSEADGNPVRVIHSTGLSNRDDITSFTVPEGVLVLGTGVMSGMKNLKSVSLPGTLQVLGIQCFFHCDSLEEITIPASVRVIAHNAVTWCKNMKTVTFEGPCPVLTERSMFLAQMPKDLAVYVPDDQLEAYRELLTAVKSEQIRPSGKNALPRPELHAEFTMDPETGTLLQCSSEDTWIDVPAEIDGVPVKAVGQRAFHGNDFCYAVNLPEGLEEIAPKAFDDLSRLLYAPIPSTVRSIGEEAYAYYGGYRLTLPEGLEEISRRAFFRSALSMDLVIPEGVTRIGDEAFEGTNLYGLSLPSSLVSIGEKAFKGHYLSRIHFETLVLPEIAEDAFLEQAKKITVSLPPAADEAAVAAAQAFFDTLGKNYTAVRLDEPSSAYPDSPYAHPAATEAPAPETPVPETPAPEAAEKPAAGGNPGPGDGSIALDTKYVCVRYLVNGKEMDASILGAELSATLHADGSLDFIMLGKPVDGLTWTWDGRDAVADYYSAGQLRFSPAEDGTLVLDFVGAMTYILAIP